MTSRTCFRSKTQILSLIAAALATAAVAVPTSGQPGGQTTSGAWIQQSPCAAVAAYEKAREEQRKALEEVGARPGLYRPKRSEEVVVQELQAATEELLKREGEYQAIVKRLNAAEDKVRTIQAEIDRLGGELRALDGQILRLDRFLEKRRQESPRETEHADRLRKEIALDWREVQHLTGAQTPGDAWERLNDNTENQVYERVRHALDPALDGRLSYAQRLGYLEAVMRAGEYLPAALVSTLDTLRQTYRLAEETSDTIADRVTDFSRDISRLIQEINGSMANWERDLRTRRDLVERKLVGLAEKQQLVDRIEEFLYGAEGQRRKQLEAAKQEKRRQLEASKENKDNLENQLSLKQLQDALVRAERFHGSAQNRVLSLQDELKQVRPWTEYDRKVEVWQEALKAQKALQPAYDAAVEAKNREAAKAKEALQQRRRRIDAAVATPKVALAERVLQELKPEALRRFREFMQPVHAEARRLKSERRFNEAERGRLLERYAAITRQVTSGMQEEFRKRYLAEYRKEFTSDVNAVVGVLQQWIAHLQQYSCFNDIPPLIQDFNLSISELRGEQASQQLLLGSVMIPVASFSYPPADLPPADPGDTGRTAGALRLREIRVERTSGFPNPQAAGLLKPGRSVYGPGTTQFQFGWNFRWPANDGEFGLRRHANMNQAVGTLALSGIPLEVLPATRHRLGATLSANWSSTGYAMPHDYGLSISGAAGRNSWGQGVDASRPGLSKAIASEAEWIVPAPPADSTGAPSVTLQISGRLQFRNDAHWAAVTVVLVYEAPRTP